MVPTFTRRVNYIIWTSLLLGVALGGVVCSLPYGLPRLTARWETEYTDGFSDGGLAEIGEGDSMQRAAGILGLPFAKHEGKVQVLQFSTDGRQFLVSLSGRVLAAVTPGGRYVWDSPCDDLSSLVENLGAPIECKSFPDIQFWSYSRSPNSTHFFRKALYVDVRTGVVLAIVDELYFD